ncbi:MAG: Rrf2 family transcriptional regulator [Myxococcota bacterium]
MAAVNGQLTIALHIVGFLASRDGEPLTSGRLARTYGTSPVVLRRVLAKLQQAGLVQTQRGVGGGAVLARDADEINLREVFEAVSGESKILPRHPGDGEGGVAPVLAEYINELYTEAERALLTQLEEVSVASMDRTVRHRIYEALDCAEPGSPRGRRSR